MVFCTYCGREFSRNEHLQRHVLTHTKVRPFKCAICHLSFTRLDLVRKHYKVHTRPEVDGVEQAVSESLQNGTGRGASTLVGQRAAVACTACAKTKTRCDQQSPCGRCRSKGLDCIPRVPRRNINSKTSGATAFSSLQSTNTRSSHDERILEVATPVSDEGPSPPSSTSPVEGREAATTHQADTEMEWSPVVPPSRISDRSQSRRQPEYCSSSSAPQPSLYGIPSGYTPVMQQPAPSHGPERPLEIPFLPHLDWRSLLSNPEQTYRQSEIATADVCSPQDNAFQRPDTGTRGSDVDNFILDPDDSTANIDGLFSFNMGESTWHTNLAAVDSILADCLQFPPKTSTLPKAPNAAPEVARDENNHYRRDSLSTQQYPTPRDFPTPSDTVIAEEDLDHWPLSQCTAPSAAPITYPSPEEDPMRQGYQDTVSWSYAIERYRDSCFEPHERIENVDLTDETREWMLIAVQHFLRAGMEVEDARKLSELLGASRRAPEHTPEQQFLLLPPKTSLHKYLDIFLTTFEPFMPMIPALSLNPNKLASRNSERGATLLLFLMIASGSMIDPAPRARQFSHELTEVCRHSLKRATEGFEIDRRDTLALHCALLFTVQACYSGRKSRMELGATQRHLYLAMMRNAGLFQRQGFTGEPTQPRVGSTLDEYWKEWMDHEISSRLCYSWVIVDQEISLFYDTPPLLLPSELQLELPADEKLWMAPNAEKWKSVLEAMQRNVSAQSRGSLYELFLLFAEDKLDLFRRNLNVMDMRLLLHPLHSMVFNYSQVKWSLGTGFEYSTATPGKLGAFSTEAFGEIHDLLRRWYLVFTAVDVQGARLAVVARATLMQYHAIAVNLLCSMKRLEAFCRRENPQAEEDVARSIEQELSKHSAELLVHCGQILRLVRETDIKLRPPWWSLAVYRASLVLWVYSLTREMARKSRKGGQTSTLSGPPVALDALPFFDPVISHFVLYKAGIPHLTVGDKNIQVGMEEPREVLKTCIEAFGRGPRIWRIARALQCKLESVCRNWEPMHQRLEESVAV
ncbi:hypothetical protein BX600DRAFT_551818 [Xylariales sp. PMI_506]|nr:hypothetical protein BX600DRAFT_551818 [Xylariales sp. PMI_506]